MKISDLLCEAVEEVSVKQLETSPRIEKRCAVGYYAVVSGNKLWKTNLMSIDDARSVIDTYRATKQDVGHLKIVRVVN